MSGSFKYYDETKNLFRNEKSLHFNIDKKRFIEINELTPNTVYRVNVISKNSHNFMSDSINTIFYTDTVNTTFYTKAQKITDITINELGYDSASLIVYDNNPIDTEYLIEIQDEDKKYYFSESKLSTDKKWIKLEPYNDSSDQKIISINSLSPNKNYNLSIKARNRDRIETLSTNIKIVTLTDNIELAKNDDIYNSSNSIAVEVYDNNPSYTDYTIELKKFIDEKEISHRYYNNDNKTYQIDSCTNNLKDKQILLEELSPIPYISLLSHLSILNKRLVCLTHINFIQNQAKLLVYN